LTRTGTTGAGSCATASARWPQLERIFQLSPDEHAAVARHKGSLPVGITPYYASLMGRDDPQEPLRRTHIPVGQEYLRAPGEADDPLGEDHDTRSPGLVHRYPDRVLFLTTGFCSTYCRYCTRSRMVGEDGGEYPFSTRSGSRRSTTSRPPRDPRRAALGRRPADLADEKLDWLLGRLRAIPHVEFVRIGTKVPAVLPQRITRALTRACCAGTTRCG
jgi:lysine 2,3-aminomutase